MLGSAHSSAVGLRARGAGLGYARSAALRRARCMRALASLEAPPRPAEAAAGAPAGHAALLAGLRGPLVKFTAHYHVSFGDCLKVVGSSPELGAWDVAAAPLMAWGEGDVWSLVLDLPPGSHEFKVVVQQGGGGVLWEGGDANRVVAIPDDAPSGSMLVAECAFNHSELMPEPELQPVSPDVLQALEARAGEELAAAEAALAAEAEVTHASEAAAAVAKAIATMDAEAEETGARSRGVSSEYEPQPDAVEPAAESDVAALLEPAAAAAAATAAVAAAEEELQEHMAAMSREAHADAATSTPVAALRAKLAADRPAAVGFLGEEPPAAAARAAPAAEGGQAAAGGSSSSSSSSSSSVVAAFMRSVGGSRPGSPAASSDAEAAEPEPPVELPPAAEAVAAEAVAAEAVAVVAAEAEEAQAVPAEAAPAEAVADAAAAAVPAAAKEEAAAAEAEEVPPPTPAAAAADDEAPPSASAPAAPTSWGPSASRLPATVATSSGSDSPGGALSSGLTAMAAGTPPSSPSRRRSRSPGRGSSHVAAAVAAAAVAAEWLDHARSNEAAAREAEEAASAKAARLQAAQQAASAAAAESERLHATLRSSIGGVPAVRAWGSRPAAEPAAEAPAMPAPPGVVDAAGGRQVYEMTSASLSAALSPPPVAPAGGSAAPAPPPVSAAPGAASSASGAALAADAAPFAGSEALEAGADGSSGSGTQFLTALVGCAAVGTVLWSEFVLKQTGCGLPPGPYGLLGAAEGLSYLGVLGFAGAGAAARAGSGGKQGLPGALAVPEGLAYGAMAAGLIVLASQLHEYGYIPPPLPGGQCYADAAAVALPGGDELSAALAGQLASLQAILAQLKAAAADGLDQLELQAQLAALQAQVDSLSSYASAQAAALDASLHTGLAQLQDSVASASAAVSSFVDTQLQQLDISGKVEAVLNILRAQEQQLKVELPKQLAALQQLAATSMALVQDTALQAASAAHLPELLASLDSSMAALHDVLEARISQLDTVLSQLQGSCAAAAAQLATAVAAAEQAGATQAAAQLSALQGVLAAAMADVSAQVAAGYSQLALADRLSELLLSVRTSAAGLAASTAAEVDKLALQQQLAELESLAEASVAALSRSAMGQLEQLQVGQRLADIEAQAAAAAAALQAGLVQQAQEQLPAVQAQLGALQDSLSALATSASTGLAEQRLQLEEHGPEAVQALLLQLQRSMEVTVRLASEVAASGVGAAGDALHSAGDTLRTAGDAASAGAGQQLSGSLAAAPPSAAETLAAFASAPEVVEPAGLVASASPDAIALLQAPDEAVEAAAEIYLGPGGMDFSDASDAIKAIWANRPQ